jgi:hypothetical protein
VPDMIAIAQALNAFKAAKDIAETMIGLRDTAAFQGKLIEFQSKIIDANNAAFAAQEERSSLLQTIRDLEKEVTDLKAWEGEKERYELTDISGGNGSLAYVIKEELRSGAPLHCLCANCYQHNKKSILQRRGVFSPEANYALCPECKTQFLVWGWPPAPKASS